jgi:hypothetical protein
MADDALIGDDSIGRNEAFFDVLGLGRPFYLQAIEVSIAHAQARAADADVVPWLGFGARNIGGRVRALAQNPLQPQVWYAGLAQGGVFKSGDGGDTWAPIGGAADAFPVGAIAVAPGNPNTVYIGSGEMGILHRPAGAVLQANESFAAGRGFFRYDESAAPPTMQREVLPFTTAPAGTAGAANSFARIVVDPADAQRCWIASHTGLWRREAGPVFHNENPTQAGAAPVAPALGASVSDVIVIPNWNPQRPRTWRILAAVAAVGIFRGVFDSANPGAGTVWEPMLTDNLPLPSAPGAITWDRIRLGHCANQPQHVYAIAEDPANDVVLGVWHSADGGDHWTARPAPALGGQVWVNLYVEVHPDNPALIVAGAVDAARSSDHGANWQPIIDWRNFNAGDRAQHGDQHAAVFDAADPRRLWVANDGGVAMTSDIVQTNPRTSGSWRKRSHGVVGAQFNDIATHPTYPFMAGGGLQDNAAYVSFGGETWYVVSDGDGGQMAFEVDDPRTFYAPNQAFIARSRIVAAATTNNAGLGFVLRRIVNPDLPPPDDVFAVGRQAAETAAMTATRPLFVPLVEHHRSTAGHLLVGRGFRAATATPADVFFSTDGMNSFGAGGIPAATIGTDDITALAYGNGAPGATDWWVGTDQGQLFRRPNAGANPTTWVVVGLPAVAAALQVTRIAVHPADERYVAVSLADTAAPHQGRVLLTLDRGVNWADVTGLAAVGAPPGADPPPLSLPPSPVTSLVFDPQPTAAAAQVLYAGTLAGVYVIRNLPRRRSPPANAAVPAFNPRWLTFNGLVTAPAPAGLLPLTLVKDVRIVTLPRDAAAAASAPESVARLRLIAAMYGRGMYAADITRGYPAAIGAGGPEHRLYLRQTVVEDGLRYPRPAPTQLNAAPGSGAGIRLGGDPRVPPGTRLLSDRDAYDIRIDNAPFQFFEDFVDGVEFDEDLRTKNLKPGEANQVYVQVHTRGRRRAGAVDVDLYFAEAPDPGALNTPPVANAAPLPDLQADFWAVHTSNVLPPPAAATNAPRAVWQRVGSRELLLRVAPNQPEVARFDWVPPVALAGRFVALLALCSSTADAFAANPPTVMRELIRNERRAALRVVRAEAFVPDLYIRDGVDDDGRLGGVAFGGRSPDIIVVAAAPADPADEFKDLGDARDADRVRGSGGANVVYVRVHNRKPVDTAAVVDLFWALPHLPVSGAAGQASPTFDSSKWQVIAPVAAGSITVPASGHALARFDFNAAPAPEPGFPNALAFMALIRSSDPGDPLPQSVGVDTQDEFWRLFLGLASSNNAALRALRFA